MAAPKPASGLTSTDPAVKAKAMWAADVDNVRGIFDSEENLRIDLEHPEPAAVAHDNERRGARAMTAASAECIARPAWNENRDGCRRTYSSYESYRAAVQHRCE